MEASIELIIWLVIILIVAVPAQVLLDNQQDASKAPVLIGQMPEIMKLKGVGTWEITIMRRSGHVHSAWIYSGKADDALKVALQKVRQARLEYFSIISNSESLFAVQAFYDSAGLRRTGKYIGGFEITIA